MGWKNVKEHYRIGHIVQVRGEYIWIGSGYIPDLIVVHPNGGLSRNRNLGPFDGDLKRYWDEMEADPEKLKQLMDSPDTFCKSITVYTYDGGDIVEKLCEEPGWPNVTHDGAVMYENMYSTDRSKVIEWAKRNADAAIDLTEELIERQKQDLLDSEQRLGRFKAASSKLAAL